MKRLFFVLTILTIAFVTLLGSDKKNSSIVLKGNWEDSSDTVFIVYHDDSDNYAEEQNVLIKEYAEVLAEKLQEIIGGQVSAVSMPTFSSAIPRCIIYIGEKYDNSLYVEYLKEQNGGLLPFMPKSDEEWAKYIGFESTYSIYAKGSELHINASDEWALYWAIDDFLKEIENAEEFTFNAETKILAAEGHTFPDPTDLIGKGLNPYFSVTKKVADLPILWNGQLLTEYSYGLQGGGTDGKYAYIGGDGPGDLGRIYKYSLPEWKLESVSDPLLIKHANAISYIEDKNLLTAAHCTDSDVRGFAYIDPDSLEVVDYGETPIDCWGLEYDNSKERFLIEVNWINYIFDKDFNLIKEMPYGDQDGTPQTLYVDGDYIYDVRYHVFWDTGHSRSTPDIWGQNYITVHDYENVYIEKAPVPNITGEAEHMFRHGNKYYIGYIDVIVEGKQVDLGVVYEFIILPEIWWN